MYVYGIWYTRTTTATRIPHMNECLCMCGGKDLGSINPNMKKQAHVHSQTHADTPSHTQFVQEDEMAIQALRPSLPDDLAKEFGHDGKGEYTPEHYKGKMDKDTLASKVTRIFTQTRTHTNTHTLPLSLHPSTSLSSFLSHSLSLFSLSLLSLYLLSLLSLFSLSLLSPLSSLSSFSSLILHIRISDLQTRHSCRRRSRSRQAGRQEDQINQQERLCSQDIRSNGK